MALADLFRPKYRHSDVAIRGAAVRALAPGEIEILTQVAKTDPDSGVRRIAIEQIEQADVLADLAAAETDVSLRALAGERAAELWSTRACGDDAEAASAALGGIIKLGKLGAQQILVTIAIEASLPASRQRALAELRDPRALAEVANSEAPDEVRAAAVARIEDRDVLRALAIDTNYEDVGLAAVDKLDKLADVERLEDVAQNAKHEAMRKRARERVPDQVTSRAPEPADRPAVVPAARVPDALLKRFVCANCGANGPLPTLSPYLECEACQYVSDFDWGVAQRCPAGPRHDVLQYELNRANAPERERAFATGDRIALTQIYAEMIRTLMTECPTRYPTRISEPAYFAQLVAYEAAHRAALDLDPDFIAGHARMVELARTITWSGSWYVPETVWAILDGVLSYYHLQERASTAGPPGPPDNFVAGYMLRCCISMTIQDWFPHLHLSAQRELVQRLGVSHLYVDKHVTVGIRCGGCGGELSPPAGAERAPCPACHATIELARGGIDCRNCGATVHPVCDAPEARCPYCSAQIHDVVAGHDFNESRLRGFQWFDENLAELVRRMEAPIERIEILDGMVSRSGPMYRMITVRGHFPDGRTSDMIEVFDAPTIPGNIDLVELFAWVDMVAQRRHIPNTRTPYREHARNVWLPRDDADLDRRLAESSPTARHADVYAVTHVDGLALELVVDGTVVRLVADEDGKRTGQIRAWLDKAS